jgi:hypothetical protein
MHRGRDPPVGRESFWVAENQGHVGGCTVDEDRVCLLAVFAETFAVVGGQHDQCPIEFARRAQGIDQPSELPVRVGDFGVVAARTGGADPARRLVRLVRIEQMHPREKRRTSTVGSPLFEPGQDMIDRVGCTAFADHEQPRILFAPQRIVV